MPLPGLGDALALISAARVLVVDASRSNAEVASTLGVPVFELAHDGGNAEDVALAVTDAAAQGPSGASTSIEDRVTSSVLEWLSSIQPGDAVDTREAGSPSRTR